MTTLAPIIWKACYSRQWTGLITPESFTHPAKFSRGLIERIIRYGLDRGYWKRGDVIGDAFGGVGTGGIAAASAGLQWIGVELERRFVALAKRNFRLHSPTWRKFGDPHPIIVLGDSREFASTVGMASELVAVLTSPPYSEGLGRGGGPSFDKLIQEKGIALADYGTSRGQIGELSPGEVAAVITSPPYGDIRQEGGGLNLSHDHGGKGLDSYSEGATIKYRTLRDQNNIGNLGAGAIDAVISSPPYGQMSVEKNSGTVDMQKNHASYQKGGGGMSFEKYCAVQARHSQGYGVANGQIAGLPVAPLDAVVTSPPWEDQESSMNAGKFADPTAFASAMSAADGHGTRNGATRAGRMAQFIRATQTTYGEAEGQLGNVCGETYWQAMHQVYSQCFLAIKPGGVCCVVVKDYVKDRQRVPLCDQTLQLMESIGFQPVERIHAMLTQEEAGLWGQTKRKERKSFFRRLAESKGSPRIDWEEVLIVRKPE